MRVHGTDSTPNDIDLCMAVLQGMLDDLRRKQVPLRKMEVVSPMQQSLMLVMVIFQFDGEHRATATVHGVHRSIRGLEGFARTTCY